MSSATAKPMQRYTLPHAAKFLSDNSPIVARKWWNDRVEYYPYLITTQACRELYPQAIDEGTKPQRLDFITCGLANGGRIWAFANKQDRNRFTGMIAIKLIDEMP